MSTGQETVRARIYTTDTLATEVKKRETAVVPGVARRLCERLRFGILTRGSNSMAGQGTPTNLEDEGEYSSPVKLQDQRSSEAVAHCCSIPLCYRKWLPAVVERYLHDRFWSSTRAALHEMHVWSMWHRDLAEKE